MLLKCMLKKWVGRAWTGVINVADWLKGQVIGCCEHGNEPS